MSKASPVPFVLKKESIDYFELREEYFEKEFSVERHILRSTPSELYLDFNTNLSAVKPYDLDTTVLNVQVGRGKTMALYKLMAAYYEEGYYVIICSPFLKLVQKDIEGVGALFRKPPKPHKFARFDRTQASSISQPAFRGPVFYSEALDEPDETRGNFLTLAQSAPYLYRIHVMTIDRLLGNSGKDGVDQNFHKRQYLKELLRATKDQKVVLFFDEIHESIRSFKSSLIPNLLRWKGQVSKVFVSSATYTPSTIPVLKAISLLTDKKVSVFELPRLKTIAQAKIQLHIVKEPYGPSSRRLKSLLKRQFEYYNKLGRSVQVIAGTKVLAKELAQYCFGKEVKTSDHTMTGLAHINLLTADTDAPFKPGQNNIGTTIKTGVNIDDSKGVLIVIFPTINGTKAFSQYGIFHDGIPSFIQAIGRLRNGGNLHIVVSKPHSVLGDPSAYPNLLSEGMKEEPLHSINESYDLVKDSYKTKINKIVDEVHLMEPSLKVFKLIPSLPHKWPFGFWYPNFHEYLMTHTQALLLKKAAYGRAIAPYVVWACIHDQFANCTLSKIFYHGETHNISLQAGGFGKAISNVLKAKEAAIKADGFRKSLGKLSALIGSKVLRNGEEDPVLFEKAKGQTYTASELLRREPGAAGAAIEALYNHALSGSLDLSDKLTYLGACMAEAQKSSSSSVLIDIYKDLDNLQEEFKNWVKSLVFTFKGQEYIPAASWKNLDQDFVNRVRLVVIKLKASDTVIATKSISLLQNIEDVTLDQGRKMIFSLLSDIGFDLDPSRKQVQSQKVIEIKDVKVYQSLGLLS